MVLLEVYHSVCFSFGFFCFLSDREATEVVCLLSMLEEFGFAVLSMGELVRDICVWSPNPSERIYCRVGFFCSWGKDNLYGEGSFTCMLAVQILRQKTLEGG